MRPCRHSTTGFASVVFRTTIVPVAPNWPEPGETGERQQTFEAQKARACEFVELLGHECERHCRHKRANRTTLPRSWTAR
jgi:hypothetical protein